jgi:transcriptional regulator GlxA family with amidase domain
MFAHHTGLSPHQYRLQVRLGRARTLLSETALSVKEVAFRCGFESEHYFSRLFRRKTGVAPGRWRRSLSGGRG